MKTVLLFLFVSVSHCYGGGWLDFAYCNLSSDNMAKSSKELHDEDPQMYGTPYVSVNGVEKILEQVSEKTWEACGAISFSGNNLDDSTATKALSHIIKRSKEADFPLPRMFDLSFNHLTKSFFSKDILEMFKNPKISFIDITGNNQLENKAISTIYHHLIHLREPQEETTKIMSKLIFIKKSYLRKAIDETQIYKDYINDRILPEKWREIHHTYYKTIDVSELKKYNQQLSSLGINKKAYELLHKIQEGEKEIDTSEIFISNGKGRTPIVLESEDIDSLDQQISKISL